MSDQDNKTSGEAENPIAALKPRSKPKERALPFNMDQILAVKEDVASGQWKKSDDASAPAARAQDAAEPKPATAPEPDDAGEPTEAVAEPAVPARSALASRASKMRAPAPREERPLLKRDMVKVHVRMTREERDELHIHARRNGKSVQTLLEDFVRKTLKDINRAR
jgi:hypothetical protein